jgi:hypothetical protein
MDSSKYGRFVFLHSWSEDRDPAARRVRIPTGPVIDLEDLYLPAGDAPAGAARMNAAGAAHAFAVTALSLAAAWSMLRVK